MSRIWRFWILFAYRIPLFLPIVVTGCSLIPASSKRPENIPGPHLVQKGGTFGKDLRLTHFLKGNLHTHSLESDGDAPAENVVKWYKDHDYDFLALTEHDKRLDPARFAIQSNFKNFIMISGDELTGRSYHVPVHVNAICGHSNLAGLRRNRSVVSILDAEIQSVHEDGGLAIVNHPNFGWAIGIHDLMNASPFEMLEVASGHPLVNEMGGEKGLSHEALWDAYLTRKGAVLGVGVDDAHHYSDFVGSDRANPGKAWVQAAVKERTEQSVCEALRAGTFYFSKGPELSKISLSPTEMRIEIQNWIPGEGKVEFIGKFGSVYETSSVQPAIYKVRGDEGYIRARITLKGKQAWTQAYFLH